MTSNSTDDEPRWWHPDRTRGEFDDGPPRRGISDLVATALIALDLSTVRRATIRALCPNRGIHRETGQPTRNTITGQVNRALKRFEKNQWIRREGPFIHILNRDGLKSWIDQGVDLTDERAAKMLAVAEAVAQINTDLDTGAAVSGWDAALARRHAEVRRRELLALQRLMQSAPGSAPSGRGTVRLVHKASTL